MPVMSAYSDSESVEVSSVVSDEFEEDGLDLDGFDSSTVSGSEESEDWFGQYDNDTDPSGLCLS